MTTLNHVAVHTHRSALPARIATRVIAVMKDGVDNWFRRRQLLKLSELTDGQLADMGITRGDLYDATASRWSDDPTRRLNCLRNERFYREEMSLRRIH